MFTKGEWTVKKERSFEGNEQFVIRTYPEPTRIQRVADVFQEDNAHLIASAPDMYEALRVILEAEASGKHTELTEWEKVLALEALAKAEGKKLK